MRAPTRKTLLAAITVAAGGGGRAYAYGGGFGGGGYVPPPPPYAYVPPTYPTYVPPTPPPTYPTYVPPPTPPPTYPTYVPPPYVYVPPPYAYVPPPPYVYVPPPYTPPAAHPRPAAPSTAPPPTGSGPSDAAGGHEQQGCTLDSHRNYADGATVDFSCPAGFSIAMPADGRVVDVNNVTITCSDGIFVPNCTCVAIEAPTPQCNDYSDFQAFMDRTAAACCSKDGPDCDETGLPATCPDRGACPAAVNAFAAACGDFLDVPLNRGIQQIVDRLAASCSLSSGELPNDDCDDFAGFGLYVSGVHEGCCQDGGGTADCSSGLPTTCDHRCAILVERFHGACQSFLSQPINKAMSTMVEQTYQICLRSGGANGH